MYNKNKIAGLATLAIGLAFTFAGCQKKDRPGFGDFPTDSNPPGGPLKFFAAYDGTTDNPLMNAVDSIRANFASTNPLASVDGISGKSLQGVNRKFVTYAKPNDWASTAASFTISFWYKRDGQTKNNKGGNGPEYIMSLKQTNVDSKNHWSGSTALVFLEGNNAACAVKTMFVDKTGGDNWFTWEGGNTIPGLLDNKWHHVALVYEQTNSTMTLFIDGVANPNKRTWGTHGPANFDNDRIQEMRVGAGPAAAGDETDDWLASTWKGNIDQLRLFSTAITQAEVSALYTGKK
jgi:hypothetical protein